MDRTQRGNKNNYQQTAISIDICPDCNTVLYIETWCYDKTRHYCPNLHCPYLKVNKVRYER